MATLIPALSTCVARMTAGERRTAERLEQKLDDDYLVWYDTPVSEGQDEADEARLFYVAATRATQQLFIPLSGAGRPLQASWGNLLETTAPKGGRSGHVL